MATLTLRNCTRLHLKYWRSIAFHGTNYVAPGDEGEYKWNATYTLKARPIEEKLAKEGSRAAVDSSGFYYAMLLNGKIEILDENKIQKFSNSEDNPFVEKWVTKEYLYDDFDIDWTQISSKQNTSNTPIQWTITVKHGLSEKNTNTRRLTVTNTTSQTGKVGVEAGTTVELKKMSVSGSVENTSSSSTEEFNEQLSESYIYSEEVSEQIMTLEPSNSVVVWQAYADVFGHEVWLDHIAYSDLSDSKPTEPVLTGLTVGYLPF